MNQSFGLYGTAPPLQRNSLVAGKLTVSTQLGQALGPLKRKSNYYRSAAAELVKLSEAIKDLSLKAHYIELAAGWHELASRLESQFVITGEQTPDLEPNLPT